jgi:hypothetical protein
VLRGALGGKGPRPLTNEYSAKSGCTHGLTQSATERRWWRSAVRISMGCYVNASTGTLHRFWVVIVPVEAST